MSFKDKLLVALFLIIFSFNYCQEIAIPYRDGKSWGICDQSGKIIIEPKFDAIEFANDHSKDYSTLIPRIKEKRGLIINGSLLFDVVYDKIYESNGNYVLIKTDHKGKTTEYVNKEGKSLLQNPIIEIISSKNSKGNLLLHVLNIDLTESLLIFNLTDNSVTSLIENYYSIKFFDKIIELNSVPILTKKTKNDPPIIEAWDFTKLPEKVKVKLTHRTEKEYLYKFSEKTFQDESIGYGYQGPRVEVVEGDPGDDSLTAPELTSSSSTLGKRKDFYYTFKTEKDKIYLEKINYNDQKNKILTPIQLNVELKDVKIKEYFYSVESNDTVRHFNNFIVYKNKGKKRILFTEDYQKAVEFDSISDKIISNYDSKSLRKAFLLVGNKDEVTKKMKYNFYNHQKGYIFANFFDELKQLRVPFGTTHLFQSQVNGKYGIVTLDGEEILKANYDQINLVEQNSYTSDDMASMFRTKKGNKFGLLYKKNNVFEVVDAIYDYEPKEIILYYPVRNLADKQTVAKTITLVSLKDKKGNLIGYANVDGTLYFKN